VVPALGSAPSSAAPQTAVLAIVTRQGYVCGTSQRHWFRGWWYNLNKNYTVTQGPTTHKDRDEHMKAFLWARL